MNSIITLKGVSKVFDDKTVVDNIDLDIKKGEFVTFLGPSGCGKTTTLRMIAGFEKPTKGEVLLNGENIVNVPPHMRPINTVFQKYALFPHLNVFNNIAFGLKLQKVDNEVIDKKGNKKIVSTKISKAEIEKRVLKALKIVGLTDYEKRDVTSLSGGQQQRVAIARAIVNEPQILLLDEPLGALDLKMRQEMQLELKQMHKKLGITFIYVTHDQEEALTLSDTIIVMNDGMIYQSGTPTDIYNEPVNSFVADFIGESNIFDGKMQADMNVSFCGNTLQCVDNYPEGQLVDVVIRPEDIKVKSAGKGMFDATITSVIFKGVHYEMTAKANDYEFLIHNTKEYSVGDIVSFTITPDNIHIMEKEELTNELEVKFKSNTQLEYCGAVYDFDPQKLFPNAIYDSENDNLQVNGEEYHLKGRSGVVAVDFTKIDLTDSEKDAPLAGNVYSMVYKGKNYLVTIRINDMERIVVDTEYLWDDGDRVGLAIKPTDFRIVRIKND